MKRFKEYEHSIPIIFSHLEGQYDYELVDLDDYFVLFTQVDFHFVSGNVPSDKTEIIDVFRKYIKKHNKDAMIVMAPNKEWETFLEGVFHDINGVVDTRVTLTLDRDAFRSIYEEYSFSHFVKVHLKKDALSKKEYPAAEIIHEGNVVSFCNGFLVGDGHIEIDVWTDEKYRNRGMAFETSLQLINYALEHKLEPVWTAWKAKVNSLALAGKLGFKSPRELKAFVWISKFGEF